MDPSKFFITSGPVIFMEYLLRNNLKTWTHGSGSFLVGHHPDLKDGSSTNVEGGSVIDIYMDKNTYRVSKNNLHVMH